MEGKAVAYEPLASNYDWQQIQNELREVAQDISLYIIPALRRGEWGLIGYEQEIKQWLCNNCVLIRESGEG